AFPKCAIGPRNSRTPPLTDTFHLSLVSPTFAEHLQQPIPEFLYHYTSQEGLLGIIDSSSLWATNIGYMNDATEFTLDLKLITQQIVHAIPKLKADVNFFTERLPLQAEQADIKAQRATLLWKLANNKEGTSMCVACFCEDDDLLSQWRGYARTGYGY